MQIGRPMFELADISVRFGPREALSFDRLVLPSGGFTAVLGHNGSGKSTLFRLLARELAPTRGTIRLRGEPLAAYRQRRLAQTIAHLPQRLPEAPGLTVRELAALGRFPWRAAFGRWREEDEDALIRALDETDLVDFADALVDDLSGGERQRAWIAMLLAQDAPILLLDEPISALDPAHQIELLQLLARLAATGRDVLAILHDINLAARFATRIVALKAGRIAFDGQPREFLDRERLAALYDIPVEIVARPRGLPLAVITGDVP